MGLVYKGFGYNLLNKNTNTYINNHILYYMTKLKFKRKCRVCKDVWVAVESRQPIICDKCKKNIEKYRKEKKE